MVLNYSLILVLTSFICRFEGIAQIRWSYIIFALLLSLLGIFFQNPQCGQVRRCERKYYEQKDEVSIQDLYDQ